MRHLPADLFDGLEDRMGRVEARLDAVEARLLRVETALAGVSAKVDGLTAQVAALERALGTAAVTLAASPPPWGPPLASFALALALLGGVLALIA